MSKWIDTGLPCPCGKSSDAFALDKDGNGYCFSGSCESPYFRRKDLMEKNNPIEEPVEHISSPMDSDYRIHEMRGLRARTLDFYNIITKFVDDEPYEVGFVYPKGGVKIRNLQEKRFKSHGNMGQETLYAKDKFDPGSHESITITEGEWDAPSVYQMIGGRGAAVSVRSASTAHGDCVKEFDYLNSFKKIYLCFDNDAAGKKALEKIAPIFDFRKVYIVNLTLHKDASDYLQNHESEIFVKAWENARRYSPDNIISSFADIRKTLAEKQNERVGTYPLAGLQNALKGLHRGEFVLFKGDEGIGKTEIFRAMEYHLLQTEKSPIGILHFEESNNTSIRGIVTYELEQPAAADDSDLSDEEVFESYKRAVGGDENRLFIRRSYDLDDVQGILDNIRFMVAGCGCDVVFFDHISWLAASDENVDERKKLDALAQKFKMLCEELHFCIVVISHVNDDGKTRGSRYIAKVANTVIHMVRDKTTPDVGKRLRTYFFVEKGRAQGTQTGPAGFGVYDLNTYTLKDGENHE